MQFIKENAVIEPIDTLTRPIQQIDEIGVMYEDVMKNLKADLTIPKDVLASFQIKNDLNPDIWKGVKLLPEISKSLKTIAEDFFKSLELDVEIKDILFVGSLANYNWSKFSDVDLHIVLDFKKLGADDQIQNRFWAEKELWNKTHDVKIHDFPVEVYVQDIKEKLDASAVYSILKDKWLLMPEKSNFKLDKKIVKRKVDAFFDDLKEIKKLYDNEEFKTVVTKIEKLKKSIKKMRQSGLEGGGEFSTENIVFKILRRTDFMEILDTYKIKAYDNQVSITA